MARLPFSAAFALSIAILSLSLAHAKEWVPSPGQQAELCGSDSSCRVSAATSVSGFGPDHWLVQTKFVGTDDQDNPCWNSPLPNEAMGLWLVTGEASPQKILQTCIGPWTRQEHSVMNGVLHYHQSNEFGENYWPPKDAIEQRYQLYPLRMLSSDECIIFADGHRRKIEFDGRIGNWRSAEWFDDDRREVCPADILKKTSNDTTDLVVAENIPYADIEEAIGPGIGLDDCALTLSTDGRHGFMVDGSPARPQDTAIIKILAEDDEHFLVQIDDPHLAKEPKKFSRTDRSAIIFHYGVGETGDWTDDEISIDSDGNAYHRELDELFSVPVEKWHLKGENGQDLLVLRIGFSMNFPYRMIYRQAYGNRSVASATDLSLSSWDTHSAVVNNLQETCRIEGQWLDRMPKAR